MRTVIRDGRKYSVCLTRSLSEYLEKRIEGYITDWVGNGLMCLSKPKKEK